MTRRRLSRIEDWIRDRRQAGEQGEHLDYLDECASAIRRLLKQVAPPPPALTDPAFLAFWEEWPHHPRKSNRNQCAEDFARLSREDKRECIQGVRAAKGSSFWQKDGGQYIPSPLKFVRERQWEGFTGQNASGISKMQWINEQIKLLKSLWKEGKYEEAYQLDVKLRDPDKFWEEERARVCDEYLQ